MYTILYHVGAQGVDERMINVHYSLLLLVVVVSHNFERDIRPVVTVCG